MVTSITAQLAAGRFGLSPSSALRAGAGLKLAPVNSGLTTGDPAGEARFTSSPLLELENIC